METEIAAAMHLLRGISDAAWSGRRSIVPIDSVCKWRNAGQPACDRPLHAAVVFEDTESAHVLVLCEHHTTVMETAIDRWREIA